MTCSRQVQRSSWFAVLAALTIVLILGTPICSAQQPSYEDVYLVSAYSNNSNSFNVGQAIYIVNPGNDGGLRCASVYVFADNAEMLECCSCPVRENNLIVLTVKDITAQPITHEVPKAGVIKIVSSLPTESGTCDPEALVPSPTLRAWMTHLQVIPAGKNFHRLLAATPSLSVVAFDKSVLSGAEKYFLPLACSYDRSVVPTIGYCSCPSATTLTND